MTDQFTRVDELNNYCVIVFLVSGTLHQEDLIGMTSIDTSTESEPRHAINDQVVVFNGAETHRHGFVWDYHCNDTGEITYVVMPDGLVDREDLLWVRENHVFTTEDEILGVIDAERAEAISPNISELSAAERKLDARAVDLNEMLTDLENNPAPRPLRGWADLVPGTPIERPGERDAVAHHLRAAMDMLDAWSARTHRETARLTVERDTFGGTK